MSVPQIEDAAIGRTMADARAYRAPPQPANDIDAANDLPGRVVGVACCLLSAAIMLYFAWQLLLRSAF